CEHLNIDLADTVAIGDAPNDIEVLKTVGYSVAMGNAIDEVKQIADFITTDNDHDGVLYAIKRIYEM
ncbi:MAG: HAD hydrolase family protein, partial [Selenomonadaceae bacterium]|nr:HAD hydrolase family protein [Selenomonadaceae bacterium]